MLVKNGNKNGSLKMVSSAFPHIRILSKDVKYVLLSTNDYLMGTTNGSGRYVSGTAIIIKAIPKNGYEFVRWSDGNTETIREIVLTENTELTAHFQVATVYDIIMTGTNRTECRFSVNDTTETMLYQKDMIVQPPYSLCADINIREKTHVCI